jgi:hypothetical protein
MLFAAIGPAGWAMISLTTLLVRVNIIIGVVVLVVLMVVFKQTIARWRTNTGY